MKRLFVLFVLGVLLSLPAVVFSKDRAIVSPSAGILRAVSSNPPTSLPKGLVSTEGFRGSLRFEREITAPELLKLQELGVEFSFGLEGEGRVDHVGPIYPAFVGWKHFEQLLSFPGLVQVESDYLRRPVASLNVTRPLTHSDVLAQLIDVETNEDAGAGVKIADWDSGIDPYHPAFFNADGGAFPWLDINHDGALTFGVDAVDLNGDGLAGDDEVLRYLDVTRINFYGQNPYQELNGNGEFDIDFDWIYVDANGNGERDYGRDAGFDDSTPTYGELILIPDDVNRDGVLQPDERLVALGTSKIYKVYVKGTEYVRGSNLSEIRSSMFGGEDAGYPNSLHGTGVSGILVGNNAGGQRYVGMAPNARLYFIDNALQESGSWGDDSDLLRIAWAKNQAVDIVLYEFSMWAMTFMDGTSNLEAAMDQLYVANGMLNVVPAGNLATSGKHMSKELGPGDTTVRVLLPEEWPDYYHYPFETPALIVSFYWYGNPGTVGVKVAAPGQTAVTLPEDGYSTVAVAPGMSATAFASTSAAGYTMYMAYIWDDSQIAVTPGEWTFTLSNGSGAAVPVHGYLMDWVSSWSRVPIFLDYESDDTTICHPSTADSAISVAAYGGEFGTEDELGFLRDYSSRGPRMDGEVAIDITAPDDPYTTLPEWDTSNSLGAGTLFGAYSVFGGTSGAGPHVAGSLALLRQRMKDQPVSAVWQALIEGADQEDFMGELPNKNYGHGKLDIYRAATGQEPSENQPPVAVLSLARAQGLYLTLSGADSYDPDGEPVQYRFDLNYDGHWDTAWTDDPEIEYGYAESSHAVLKLAVRDPKGARHQAILSVDVSPDLVWPPETPDEPVVESEADVVATPDGSVTADLVAPDTAGEIITGDVAASDLSNPDEVPSRGGTGCNAAGSPAAGGWLLLVLSLARGLWRRTRLFGSN